MLKKMPNPIDVHVGSRVRMQRMLISMSQEKLGDQLGLTFQQVQKYEKGANRIGASRLYHISQILGVPIEFFYEGLPAEGTTPEGFAERGSNFDFDLLSTSEGIQLNSAFFSIKNPKVRKQLLDLVKTLAAQDEAG